MTAFARFLNFPQLDGVGWGGKELGSFSYPVSIISKIVFRL